MVGSHDHLAGLVALLAEGVDRNNLCQGQVARLGVALLAEGVDRNFDGGGRIALEELSPSSRRAWIEITLSRSGSAWGTGRPPRGGRG